MGEDRLGESFEIEAPSLVPCVGPAKRSPEDFDFRRELVLNRGDSLSDNYAVTLVIEGHKTSFPLSSKVLQQAASELKGTWDGALQQNGVVGISLAYGLETDRAPKYGIVFDPQVFVDVFDRPGEVKAQWQARARKHIDLWNKTQGSSAFRNKRKHFSKCYTLKTILTGNPYSGAVRSSKLYVDMHNFNPTRCCQNDVEVKMDVDCTTFALKYIRSGSSLPSKQGVYLPHDLLSAFLEHPQLKEAIQLTKRFLASGKDDPEAKAQAEGLYWSYLEKGDEEEALRSEIKRRMRKRKGGGSMPPPPAPDSEEEEEEPPKRKARKRKVDEFEELQSD